jgi:predicted Zn-dependent peptidase
MLSKGSAFRDQKTLSKDLEKDSITLFTYGSKDAISCETNFSVEDMNKALDAMLEITQNPRLNQQEFEETKQKLLHNLSQTEKSAQDKLNKELFDEWYTTDETIEHIKNVKLEDVKKLYLFHENQKY